MRVVDINNRLEVYTHATPIPTRVYMTSVIIQLL